MRVSRSPNASDEKNERDTRGDGATTDETVDAAVDRLAHLPGAAARGGVGRPRRWLGAQMRSLRRGLGAPVAVPEMAHAAGSGNKLTRLASIGGALLAGCVAPRRRTLGDSLGDGDGDGERVSSSFFTVKKEEKVDPNAFGEFLGRASPTLAAAAAAEAARSSASAAAASASEAARREERDDFSGKDDSLLLDDDLDLDAHASLGDVSSSRMLERLEGEAAQEVLKLQEELSVIQAADGADDDAFETFQNFETFETFEASASGRARSAARAEDCRNSASGANAPLPAPRTTPSDPVALLGPGAPEAIREAARTIGEQIATDDGAVGREPEYLVSGKPAVDGETLAARVATGKGGSNWSDSSSKEKTPKEIKEDADAFAVKLYPAGRILHMVSRREPGSSREDDLETSAKRYELYADVSVEAYDRIRLSRTMLSDHFLPKYIEALEDVRAGLEAETRS
jgi:hypothetical protein